MNFFKRLSERNYLLRINVKPNAKKQEIFPPSENDMFLSISLRSKAIMNKANIELINLIRKLFSIESNQIQLISGTKSRDKIIKIEFREIIDEEEFQNYLK